MDYQEAHGKPEENVTYPQSEPSFMSAKNSKSQQPEPVTPVQRESVITREDVPNPIFRFGVTLALLTPLLVVTAIYYGIINP